MTAEATQALATIEKGTRREKTSKHTGKEWECARANTSAVGAAQAPVRNSKRAATENITAGATQEVKNN